MQGDEEETAVADPPDLPGLGIRRLAHGGGELARTHGGREEPDVALLDSFVAQQALVAVGIGPGLGQRRRVTVARLEPLVPLRS